MIITQIDNNPNIEDLSVISTHLEGLNDTFIKFGDNRGPISIKRIYLRDVKNRCSNLNELAVDYFNFILLSHNYTNNK